MSVDTRATGRRLDSYHRTQIGDIVVLIDRDLARLSVEVTVMKSGLLGRGIGVHVDSVDVLSLVIKSISFGVQRVPLFLALFTQLRRHVRNIF